MRWSHFYLLASLAALGMVTLVLDLLAWLS
jgi:hypothetical protein